MNWTDEKKQKLIELRQGGKTYREISDIFGVSENALKKAYGKVKGKAPVAKEVSNKRITHRGVILVISDLHIPYHHPDTVKFLTWVKKKYKPTLCINLGDEVDNHAISFHNSDPDLPSAGDELKKAILELKPLYKLFPDMLIMESNHGSLAYRKQVASGLPRNVIKSYNEILEAPHGWQWLPDLIVETELGSVYFCHQKYAAAGRLAGNYGMSCVQGHYHERCQIKFTGTPDKLIFDIHVGCMVDNSSLAFRYNKLNVGRPLIACLIIDCGVPRILPMLLDGEGRWVGKDGNEKTGVKR